MSTQLASAVSQPPPIEQKEVKRGSVNYHPSVWGDYFVTYTSDEGAISAWSEETEKLKGEVRKMLNTTINNNNNNDDDDKKIQIIDDIQRLGIAYHFQREIHHVLHQIISMNNGNPDGHDYDGGGGCGDDDGHYDDNNGLYTMALRFRLLRQHGYFVSPDIFIKFIDSEGNFKNTLRNDLRGLLSLYEASYLRVHGEQILDQALDFTKNHLVSLDPQQTPPSLVENVVQALERPLRKALSRIYARDYFSIYQSDPSHDETLLRLAKLDYNIVQKIHQKEVREISRWWIDKVKAKQRFGFARDRIVELYFWITGEFSEPENAMARKHVTKIIAMTSILDDIFDVYGTPCELHAFTLAFQRWEIGVKDELPECMKQFLEVLFDVYDEMERDLANEGRAHLICYAKDGMKTLVKAYHEESKWLEKDEMPTMGEYMKVALITTGYPMLIATSFVLMGENATKEACDWFQTQPKIVEAASIVTRFMDDIVSHKFEQQRKHIPSVVECYMNQYRAIREHACKEINKQVEDAWKDINQALLEPLPVPMPLLTSILNLTRVMDLMYKYEDGYTHASPGLEARVNLLLVEPVEV